VNETGPPLSRARGTGRKQATQHALIEVEREIGAQKADHNAREKYKPPASDTSFDCRTAGVGGIGGGFGATSADTVTPTSLVVGNGSGEEGFILLMSGEVKPVPRVFPKLGFIP
jgi:hypothetical protein